MQIWSTQQAKAKQLNMTINFFEKNSFKNKDGMVIFLYLLNIYCGAFRKICCAYKVPFLIIKIGHV